jgi:hypothetical protein
MRPWAILLGGLAIWAVHFFVLYAIASVLPGMPEARWLATAATVPAVAADGLILWNTIGNASRLDPLDRWVFRLGGTGAAISLIAVIWQCAAALIV